MGAGGGHAKVVIVGAGFSGLGMAIRLKRDGEEDFLVLERGDRVGGTWSVNTYPGCRCDVPSHLYSFSFAPNTEWSQTYSAQQEIRAYLQNCSERFGIGPHLRAGVEVLSASWREEDALWAIETTAGPFTASVLVCAMGPLTEPVNPAVPGLDSFTGKVMHSARWDHDYSLVGKRVASIGTGASAIQYVPQIAQEVDQLYVFQRTAPWVMPHNNRPITDFERRVYRRVPMLQRLMRGGIYAGRELLVLGFAKQPRLMRAIERLGNLHMDRQISDPGLRARVQPNFTLGCKRILPSNEWYPALQRPNVELMSGALAEVRPRSVIDANGEEREVDAVILGTGFHVTDPLYAGQVRGRDGRLLSDVWQGSPRAYMGTAIPGFPNLFVLLGPNTGLGHSSMIYMIESQIEHVRRAIVAREETGAATIEVTPEAHAAYNDEIDSKLRGTVWDTGGCVSYYQDAKGRNATLWPDFTWRFRRRLAQLEPGAYALRSHDRETVSA